jgi:hypothetical protein
LTGQTVDAAAVPADIAAFVYWKPRGCDVLTVLG